jgi:hypothetical protein
MALGDSLLTGDGDPVAQRRFKQVAIDPALLLTLLAGAGEYTLTGIPADARVHRAAYDLDRDWFRMTLVSAEFPILYEGEEIPPLALGVRRLEPDHVV